MNRKVVKPRAVKHPPDWLYVISDPSVDRISAGTQPKIEQLAKMWAESEGDALDQEVFAKQLKFYRFDRNNPNNIVSFNVETIIEIHLDGR